MNDLPYQISHQKFNNIIQQLYPITLRLRLIELVDCYDDLLKHHRTTLGIDSLAAKITLFMRYFTQKSGSLDLLQKYGLWICIYGEGLLDKIYVYVKRSHKSLDNFIFLSDLELFENDLQELGQNLLFFVLQTKISVEDQSHFNHLIENILDSIPFQPTALHLHEFTDLKEELIYLKNKIKLYKNMSLQINSSDLLRELYHFIYLLKKTS